MIETNKSYPLPIEDLGDGSARDRSIYFLQEQFGNDWDSLYGKKIYEYKYNNGVDQSVSGTLRDSKIFVIEPYSLSAYGSKESPTFYFDYPTEETEPTVRGAVKYDQGKLEVSVTVDGINENGKPEGFSAYLKRDEDGKTRINYPISSIYPENDYTTDDQEFYEFNGGIHAEEVLSFVEEQYYDYVEKLDILTEKYFPGYLETLSDEQRFKFTYA